MRSYFRNLLRPWKVISFVLGTAFFVWGAYFWAVPTWDVGVSLLMGTLCYLLAPFAMDLVILSMRHKPDGWLLRMAAGAAIIYFVGSGSYEIYNTWRMGTHPVTYWENLFFSVPVTIIAGLLWRLDASIREIYAQVRASAS